MKPFDIFSWQPSGWPAPHPCVIVSHPDRVANKPDVNVLMCSTKPAARPAQAGEIILDTADGLNWPTICKCDLIHAVKKTELKNQRGHVSEIRRRQLVTVAISAMGWTDVLAGF